MIGPSGAGKTTFVKRVFAKGRPFVPRTDLPVPVCSIDRTAFIGKYGLGIRTEGTDTLSYNAIHKILETLDLLMASDAYDAVVVEGDRVNNGRFFAHILRKGYATKLYFIDCAFEICMARLKAADSKITERFVRATRTKSLNNFIRYRRIFKGVWVDGGD